MRDVACPLLSASQFTFVMPVFSILTGNQKHLKNSPLSIPEKPRQKEEDQLRVECHPAHQLRRGGGGAKPPLLSSFQNR
jgi:hypothetical protein